MGTHVEFGPPSETLDPRSPDGLKAWKGTRRLSKAQLAELVRVVEAQGWEVDETGGTCYVGGRGGEEPDFEEMSFDGGGGWFSKPSSDDDEAEEQFELVISICEYAGWVVFDPQAGGIWFGVDMRCERCTRRMECGASMCPEGHPVTDPRVEITVAPPPELPDEEQDEPRPPDDSALRSFQHPDGRKWEICTSGAHVELVIVLPDGERIPRTRKLVDATAAQRDMQERIASQLVNGFVEVQS